MILRIIQKDNFAKFILPSKEKAYTSLKSAETSLLPLYNTQTSISAPEIRLRTDCKLLVDYASIYRGNRFRESTIDKVDIRPNDYMYLQLERQLAKLREVMFTKVKGHGPDKNNVQADLLAKSILEKKGIKVR